MTRKPHFISEGIRHATINGHRFHLRLTDPTEENFLWIDGQSPPLVLDQVAAEFLGLLIDGMWKFQQGTGDESERVRDFVVDKMYQKYGRPLAIGQGRVTRKRVRSDLDRAFGTLLSIAEGECPLETGLGTEEIHQTSWGAPARMDLALTYSCNLDCPHCYTGGPQTMKELSTAEWMKVYEILWGIGIPQLVFTGGEPTLRKDLLSLISEADEFVTGLVTNGTLLEGLAPKLRDASLDYIQVTLESHDPQIHNRMVGATQEDAHCKTVAGIRKALNLGLEVVTNTTLTSKNANEFEDLLRFGKELGLKNMACNSIICSGRGKAAKGEYSLTLVDLKAILHRALKRANGLGMQLQWYSPTCYHDLNPVELGFGPKSCSAAAHNMTIQPDGTLLPCQSWPEIVGNILEDPWESIWNHPSSRNLREHGFGKADQECESCEDLPLCGGGCPLDKGHPRKEKT